MSEQTRKIEILPRHHLIHSQTYEEIIVQRSSFSLSTRGGAEYTENQLIFLAPSEISNHRTNCQLDIRREPGKDKEFIQDQTTPNKNYQSHNQAGIFEQYSGKH